MSSRGGSGGREPHLPTPFAEQVLDLVEQIPAGLVLTYSDVADLLGEGGARAVGTVMSKFGSGVPWHRVIRASGEPARGHEERALALLASEGTPMVLVGDARPRRVDLRVARWDGHTPAPHSIP